MVQNPPSPRHLRRPRARRSSTGSCSTSRCADLGK
uniref:Uncharacterized protein n=1 Tax=Arundo donax TaxID=35708 RepID=A0A0A9AGN6_ARUDO